jgi:hypothetical protein
MKTQILKVSLVVIAAISFTDCNEYYLERYPLDEISGEIFWNTENDLMIYNNTLYEMALDDNNVPILHGHDVGYRSTKFSFWYLDEMADNLSPSEVMHDFYQKIRAGKNIIPTDADNYFFGWGGWDFIRAINHGLAHYDESDVTDSIKNMYIGEARLFRGWFYGEKAQKFGDIPWLDKELNIDSPELEDPRTDREDVMTNVLADLNFACRAIPKDWRDGNAPGRLNRWCALAVKARICLFEGTWRKYHGGSDPEMWLQEAASAAKEIMDIGPYFLYDNCDTTTTYNAIHRLTNTDLPGNPEIMYWRRYELGILINNIQWYFHSKEQGKNGGTTKSMVEDYLCTDGLPITVSPLYKGDAVYENIFENRDPRLRQSILHPADQPIYRYGNHDFEDYAYPRIRGMTGGLNTNTGYHVIKNYEVNAAHATWNTSSTPAIVLRFGEVLLNYAEAKAELGTITQGDLDVSINLLRRRVGMPHLDMSNIPVDPRYTSDGVSPLIVEIRRERRVELFIEGFRYNDLRRWKQGKKLEVPDYGMRWDEANRNRMDPDSIATIKSSIVDGIEYLEVYKGTDYEIPEFDESKHYLWPIPRTAISQNPNLGQTPGWE